MKRAAIPAILLPASVMAMNGPTEPQAAPPSLSLDMPAYEMPAERWQTVDDANPSPEQCRDRIHRAREASGQPQLDQNPATPDSPPIIWAVDRRVEGCSVMVVKGNPDDIRPLPAPPEDAAGLIPID